MAECADSVTYFNSRPSARGDHRRKWRDSNAAGISIHAPPRGATCTAALRWLRSTISIHAPPRGATPPVPRHRRPPHHFNSRPSARGDRMSSAASLAWCYFNSRPSARGDITSARWSAERDLFQFTPLREGRQDVEPEGNAAFLISIHAPPRGATELIRANWPSGLFQFTPLREGRPFPLVRRVTLITFQFTPLREGRRYTLCRRLFPAFYFNSRPSARGDEAKRQGFSDTTAFQFTPLREGRPFPLVRRVTLITFQFTPLREGRQYYNIFWKYNENFNSRPSARGDVKNCHAPPSVKFQFTPLREGRPHPSCPRR